MPCRGLTGRVVGCRRAVGDELALNSFRDTLDRCLAVGPELLDGDADGRLGGRLGLVECAHLEGATDGQSTSPSFFKTSLRGNGFGVVVSGGETGRGNLPADVVPGSSASSCCRFLMDCAMAC